MARYELGAVYKIPCEDGRVYYVRLLGDNYGVFAPFDGEPNEEILAKTPYRLYFSCNTFAVKRGIWEKVLPSPDKADIERWKVPDLANYGNFNPVLFLEQHRLFRDGNPYVCDKSYFIQLVKDGLIENIFNRHENIPEFLSDYYDGWPESYIFHKHLFSVGTPEHLRAKMDALNEMGYDTDTFKIESTSVHNKHTT